MEPLHLHYVVDGEDFTAAGAASAEVKHVLKTLGLPSDIVRRASICIYEGEINMVIHADGGTVDVEISEHELTVVLADKGPGIPDIELALQEGWSTAPEEVRGLGFGAGMGLPNMKKCSDSIDIKTKIGKGTTVIMKIRLP